MCCYWGKNVKKVILFCIKLENNLVLTVFITPEPQAFRQNAFLPKGNFALG